MNEDLNSVKNVKVVSSSEVFKYGTLTPEFYVNLDSSIKIIKDLNEKEIVDLLSPKLKILKDIVKKHDLENKNFKFSIPSRNKNIIIDVVFGNKDIDKVKQGIGKSRVSNEDFLQIAVGIHYLINDFNLEKRIEDEKAALLLRLKELENLEESLN